MSNDSADNSPEVPPPAIRRQHASEWITNGNLVSAAWRLAVPMTLGALLSDTLAIVDMFFVGRLGATAIAAVTTSGVVLHVIYTLQVGLTTGCTALVAHAVGADKGREAQHATGQTLLMGFLLAGIVAAFGIPFADDLLGLLGADADVVAAGVPYLRISAAGAIGMLTAFSLSSALRGAGDAMTPLKVMFVANGLNIVLDPILIFGWFGMPALGVAGSALASVVSAFIACCILAWAFLAGHSAHLRLHLSDLVPRPRLMWWLLKIGIYASGQMLMRNLSAIAVIRIVAGFGRVYLAAYGVGIRLWFSVLMPGIGFGNAAATLVGQNLGAQKPARAAQAAWVTAGMWAAISTVVGVVFFVFAEPAVRIFNDHPEVVAQGSSFLRWVSFTFAFTAVSVVLGRAMNGAGDTFWPMVATALSMLGVRIPLAWALARAWDSATGVWVAMAVSNAIQGVLFTAVFLWGRWKTIGSGLAQVAANAHGRADAALPLTPRAKDENETEA